MPSVTNVHPTTERMHALDALKGMPAATSSATRAGRRSPDPTGPRW
jgi:hypothetical protein